MGGVSLPRSEGSGIVPSYSRARRKGEPRMSAADDCKHPAGFMTPVIDRNRCEGKQDCVEACPYHVVHIVPRRGEACAADVFEMGQLGAAERASLSFVGRLKAWAHGNRQAYAVRAADCHGCGVCVAERAENAIKLARVGA